MSGPAQVLQQALFARLSGDAGLQELLGGAYVYDGPPRNAAAPYVQLGEMSSRDWSTATEVGAEIDFAVVAWSRAPGRSEVLAVAERVRALLDDGELALDGWRVAHLRHISTETARADKPEGRRAVLRFRARMEADAS